MFTYKNIAIAVVVLFVLVLGFYTLVKPSKKVDVTPAKPAVTAPVAPVKK
jgi:hypothetical protein